jgi:S1-C subfamily serine protease
LHNSASRLVALSLVVLLPGVTAGAPRTRAAATGASVGVASAPAALDPVQSTPEDIVERVLRLTVLIEGDGVYGSGMLLVPRRGIILTNWHVVEEMRNPRVTLFDGRVGPAKVLESDRSLDLALLEGPPVDATSLPIGDAIDLRAAQTLYAIGSPRKLGFTVCRGIVSYVGRLMDGARYIQTDLAINDGNSGGPVLNARGEVIGIMTFILRRATGLAFALPINYAIERFGSRLPQDVRRGAYLERFRSWKAQPTATVRPARGP